MASNQKQNEYTKVSISMQRQTIQKARARAAQLGFKTSFSAYLSWLTERDLESGLKKIA